MRKRLPHKIDADDGLEYKFCKMCEQWVKVTLYNTKNASWDGLETCCAECKKKKSKAFREKNPQYDKDYQKKNKDKLREYKRKYYKKED